MRVEEKRKRKNEKGSASSLRFSFFIFPFSFAFVVGCTSSDKQATTRPLTAAERQEAAIADPFGYSPMDKQQQPSDISGGKIGELDRGAMRKDIDHVFNP